MFETVFLIVVVRVLIAEADIGVYHREAWSSRVEAEGGEQLALEFRPRELVTVLERLNSQLVAFLPPVFEFLLRYDLLW